MLYQRKHQTKNHFQKVNGQNIFLSFFIVFFLNSIVHANPISTTSITKREDLFGSIPSNDNINLNLDPFSISSNPFLDDNNNNQNTNTLDGIPSSQEIGDLPLLSFITNSETLPNNFQLPKEELASNNYFDNTSPLTSQNIENYKTLFANAGSNQGIKKEFNEIDSEKIELYGLSAQRIYCSIPLEAEDIIYSSDGIQVMAEKDAANSEIIISFRGITRATNIISDITLTNYPYDESSKVHQGFLKIFQKNEKALINQVLTMINDNHPLTLTMTGFDSGGVYAIFTALALKLQGNSFQFKDINLYTFGQPRIGDKAFAQLVKEKLIVRRVIYNNDLIPHKPQIAQGYLHFDTEYWIKPLGLAKFQTFTCEGIKDQSGKYLGENPVHIGS
ncbi:hypothetical protein G9A89_020464 [Geosiphon pyriformis]|nr:hypothetical protein G9A89_020464 [Geosiphon pyriformis]